jgi:shikimate kinase
MIRKHRNVVFIGFASCGKSTAGKALAAHGFTFVDLDNVIEDRFYYDCKEILTCREIYNVYGSEFFLDLETKVLGSLLLLESTVLSTGGGAPMTVVNRPILKQFGFVVYLYAEPQVLIDRMKTKGYPAFLADNPTVDNLNKIWLERHDVYRRMADLIIDTNKLSIDEIVTEVLENI